MTSHAQETTETPVTPQENRFRTKMRIIEAEQFFRDKPLPFSKKGPYVGFHGTLKFYVTTAHGNRVTLEDGDWVIPEPSGPHVIAFAAYPVKPDIFAQNYELAALPLSGVRGPQEWQPIEDFHSNDEAMFWVIPKPQAEEPYIDLSIPSVFVPTHGGRLHIGKYRSWGSLEKATHFMLMPTPPGSPLTDAPQHEEK